MNKDLIKNDRKIALAIALKYNQLKREHLESLEVEHLVNYLFQFKWRHNNPETVYQAVVEIMETKVIAVVDYLSQQAIIDSQYNKLSDFDDLFLMDVTK